METYLDKDNCKEFKKKLFATIVFKLVKIDEVKNDDEQKEEYKKLKEELAVLNNILESLDTFIKLN
jgi:23S rRNA pseudoU1915 N3-methylase RlmH